MKVRFDTYTKSCEAATKAFLALSTLTDNLNLSISNWNGDAYNLSGEIASRQVAELEVHCGSSKWNEDASEL